MSNNLYLEAIKEAEQIKYAAEEKAKQQIVESISPQIKLLIEQKMSADSKDENLEDEEAKDVKPKDEEAEEECGTESLSEVTLDEESRKILRKFVKSSAQKKALFEKIQELQEAVKTIKKALILTESVKSSRQNKEKINLLFKNIVNEARNIKRNSIIKSDKTILQEYYKLIKELNNMSRRRKNKIDETLEDLLEMNLFEEEEGDDDLDLSSLETDDSVEDDSSDDLDLDSLEDDSDESTSEGASEITPQTTVEDLAMMAGLLEEDDDDDDKEEEDVDEFTLESLFEDDSENESLKAGREDEDIEDGENCGTDEMVESYGRRDRVLEIDENMLRREIGRMKSLREGEAKDMAHHFGGGSVEGEAFVDGVELNKLHEMKTKAAKVVRMNRMLESKLSQYKKALRGMKSQLTEMNLFNAKLLYANKLMQNRDLTIKQQRHVVESLDEAKTLGEAKILFESLSKSLVSGPAKRSSNLTESAVRRPMSSSRSIRSGQAKPMNESVALDRWATLAGIK